MIRRNIPARSRAIAFIVLLLIASLSMPVHAKAQTLPPATGITVVGYGESTAPAETALIQMVFTQEEYGPPRAPDPDATPGAQEREAVAPLVEGLQAAGVPEADIEVIVSPVVGSFYGPSGPGVARVDVQLDMPTQERILELINTAIIGAAEENLILGLIGVGYGVSDCAALEREAREAALNDARARGALQADLMGLSLGEAVAASDMPIATSEAFSAYYGQLAPTQVACGPRVPVSTGGSPVSVPLFDPTDTAEVHVYAQVAVTFAAGESTDATPES